MRIVRLRAKQKKPRKRLTALPTVLRTKKSGQVSLEEFSGRRDFRTVRLSEDVRRINMNGFKDCTSLEKIHLPPALKTIELSAFSGCRQLRALILPDVLETVGDDAFAGCVGLETISLPGSLKDLGACAFLNCRNLTEIVLPSGLRDIRIGTFAGCTNLRRVVLPDTLETIHPYAFYGCTALDCVECADPARFAWALENTPFWRSRHPDHVCGARLPMELLNHFAGELSGAVLTAMGYDRFDIDSTYRFFLTNCRDVLEVQIKYLDPKTNFHTEMEERIYADADLTRFPQGKAERDAKNRMLQERM